MSPPLQIALLFLVYYLFVKPERSLLHQKVNVVQNVSPPLQIAWLFLVYYPFVKLVRNVWCHQVNAVQCVNQYVRLKGKSSVPVLLRVPLPVMIPAQKSVRLSVSKDVHVPLVR